MVTSELIASDDRGCVRYTIDFDDFEKKIAEEGVKAFILCSPHNPSGRVWEKEELERAMDIFRKYDVYVVSDEIWSDLTLFGTTHIPTQSVSEDAKMRTIALYSPSKTFNLAGLRCRFPPFFLENNFSDHPLQKHPSQGALPARIIEQFRLFRTMLLQDASKLLSSLRVLLQS